MGTSKSLKFYITFYLFNEDIYRTGYISRSGSSNSSLCQFYVGICTGRGANMTGGDVSKLAPDGSATGLVAQGEKFFIVLCPQDFQDIKQCQILVGQPTVVAVN
jgi:hypothetical protein